MDYNHSIYVTRGKIERMMKEVQDEIMARQQKMLDGIFQRLEQGIAGAVVIQNQGSGPNAETSGVRTEQTETMLSQSRPLGINPNSLGTKRNLLGGNVSMP